MNAPKRTGAARPGRSGRSGGAAPRETRASRKRKGPDGERSWLWRWRRGLFVAGLLVAGGLAGVGYAVAQTELPPARINALTTFVCGADVQKDCNEDNAIAKFAGDQDRTDVTLDKVPKVVIDAVLAAEDKDFFKHGGIDPLGVVRAFWADVRSSGSTQGGSTITQQYVKKAFLTDERSFSRKVREAVLAIKVEQQLTKQQILERYLNTVYFGRGAYGIGAAERAYFGHDLSKVTLPEAAYLAGIIRSPGSADPATNPVRATELRGFVLDSMLSLREITQAEHDQATGRPWKVATKADGSDGTYLPRLKRENVQVLRGADIGADYFVHYVRKLLRDKGFSDSEIYGGGLRVYTSLDLNAQKAAWDSVTSTLNPGDPSAALVSLDGQGRVIAMFGGRDFEANQVNLALGTDGGGSGRQPGSAFKPFVLAEALRQDYSMYSQFNAPSRIVLPGADANGTDWKVDNAEPSTGVLNLIDATRESSNTVFAQLMLKVKPQRVVSLAEAMGIRSKLPEVNSLVLGAGEVSPLDMASAYSTFAGRGTHVDPLVITRVERRDGTSVNFDQRHSNPLTEHQADEVTYALRQVILGGTGVGANFGKQAAGKTGTTNDHVDAWFVGYLPNGATTAVWMGYENGPGQPSRNMRSFKGLPVFGGTYPATMWRKFMSSVYGDTDVGTFADPGRFDGEVLNPELTTTSSTDTTTTSSSSTTTPGSSTTTKSSVPGGSSTTTSTTSVPVSSTTAPPPPTSTTTTAPPPN